MCLNRHKSAGVGEGLVPAVAGAVGVGDPPHNLLVENLRVHVWEVHIMKPELKDTQKQVWVRERHTQSRNRGRNKRYLKQCRLHISRHKPA